MSDSAVYHYGRSHRILHYLGILLLSSSLYGQPAGSAVNGQYSVASRRIVTRTALPPSAQRFYESTWGVEIVGVKAAESGTMIRFSYRVLDPQKAQQLNDKKASPYLYDITSHARLEVPSMEKVGQLRQSSAVEEGRVYWMVFSNKERMVKPGTRVDIRIGNFLAQGLLVE